jgi:hypothetical protein
MMFFAFLSNLHGFGSRDCVGSAHIDLRNSDNQETTLIISKLIFGQHTLRIWIHPDGEYFQESHDPLLVELTIEMQQGKKIIEKKYSLVFNTGSLGTELYDLFNVPKDFFWNGKEKLQIRIKSIFYDKEFLNYYESVGFMVYRGFPD